ncbi:casein kinase II subunit beta [Trichomonascus vanleenenianus]|uniref:casein kinase 2 regulatory subunit CKB1 n=1 Tax=Trichomonascus vanleenenianus TaxID=2268995 RepID=UPI003ECB1E25
MDPEGPSSSEGSAEETWVSSFCSMVGHEYFAEVLDEFIDDDFNLIGLSSIVPNYRQALEVISDLEPEDRANVARSPNIPMIEESAEMLYGLIHARFILSRTGLYMMAEKYRLKHFGACPRYFCEKTTLLPIGRYDAVGFETVRLYCPCCQDIYTPPHSRYTSVDGAYFGTSFVGLFLDTYPEIEIQCMRLRQKRFELKIYGFKISEQSRSGPRMAWLRMHPGSSEEQEQIDREDIALRGGSIGPKKPRKLIRGEEGEEGEDEEMEDQMQLD